MNTAVFYLTNQGEKTAAKIKSVVPCDVFGKDNLKDSVKAAFKSYDNLIFVSACGIAVRMIAPYVKSKETDPAVLVIDENMKHVISLLSGHLGGANALTEKIAKDLGCDPVITTATDCKNMISFDIAAKENNLIIENIENLKYISSDIVNGKKIYLKSDVNIKFKEKYDYIDTEYNGEDSIVVISPFTKKEKFFRGKKVLYLRPKNIVIGVGCKKNAPYEKLIAYFEQFLKDHYISPISIARIATIKFKENDLCIRQLCNAKNLPLSIAEDDKINENEDKFERDDFVKHVTGVAAVAEGAAYIVSNYGKIIVPKEKTDCTTLACAMEDLTVKI